MSGLASTLRRLREEAGQALPLVSPPPAPVASTARANPMWNDPARFLLPTRNPRSAAPTPACSLTPDVRRLLQRHSQLKRGVTTLASTDRDVPGMEVSPGLRLVEITLDWRAPLASIDARFARVDADVAPAHLLHFDTETTGLAGGTGTRAFMIGAADWHQGRLRIRQLTITRMAAETAMLETFARWINSETVLVSYNGKCYDAPLLATRYRLSRLSNPLAGLAHIDLLHPVRRHWKHQWENCRLATAERQLLGVVREDDLPGSEAPAAWLTYLRGGSAKNLRRVAEHNAQDLKSLAGVLLRMGGM